MVFSLKNLQDATLGLRDGSKLEKIFHRKLASSAESNVTGVWSVCGHTFVSSNGGSDLLALDTIPRSKCVENDGLLIQGHLSPILEVLCDPLTPRKIYIVHKNSTTQCWEYTQHDCRWIKRCEFQLSNAKGVEILSVAFHYGISKLFWCERRSSGASALYSCCVCIREVPDQWSDDMLSQLGPVDAILHGCPTVSLFLLKKGICMVPILPEENCRLLLFWTFVQRSLKAYVWNYGVVDDVDKTDFKAIISDLLCTWAFNPQTSVQHIISLSLHPTTKELIVLANSFTISYFTLEEGVPVLTDLSTLSTNSSTISQVDQICSSFCLGLFYGIVWKSGLIALYEIRSGVSLCVIEVLRGQTVNVLRGNGVIPCIGFWSSDGIWKLQSKAIVDIAEEFKKGSGKTAVAPSQISFVQVGRKIQDGGHKLSEDFDHSYTTGADCRQSDITTAQHDVQTSPFDPPPQGAESSLKASGKSVKVRSATMETNNLSQSLSFTAPCSAVDFLAAWNLKHWAAKLSLTFIMSLKIFLNNPERDFEIPEEILRLLTNESVQTPALVLALLWDHPFLREFLVQLIQKYVEQNTDSNDQAIQTPPQTVLHGVMLPFLQEFLELDKKYQSAIGSGFTESSGGSHEMVPMYKPAGREALDLLMETFNSPFDPSLLTRLESLSLQHPKEVLKSVAEFLAVEVTEREAHVEVIRERWKQIFRLEWKNGRWRKSRLILKEPHNALLSLLCHWFYFCRPDWLLTIVDKGWEMVCPGEVEDSRPEEFITQSILDCLPLLNTECPDKQSVQMHNQLLWSTGQEMQALQVLLRHCKWQEALEFVSSCAEEASNLALLFTTLVKALLSNHAPRALLGQALALEPSGFNRFELLAILRSSLPTSADPFSRDPERVTLGDVHSYLHELLKSKQQIS